MLREVTVAFLLMLCLGSVRADESEGTLLDSTSTAGVADSTGPERSWYAAVGWIEFAYGGVGDSYRCFNIDLGDTYGFKPLALEGHVTLVNVIHMDGAEPKWRVSSTFLTSAIIMTIAGAGSKDWTQNYVLPTLLVLNGPHLGVRLCSSLTLFAGARPDLVLFTDDNGLYWQGDAGFRLDVGSKTFVKAMVVRDAYDPFDGPLRDGGWGFGLSLQFDLPPYRRRR